MPCSLSLERILIDIAGANAANLNWPDEFGLKMGVDGGSSIQRDIWAYAAVSRPTTTSPNPPIKLILPKKVNAAPFLSAALAGCWLSDPLNEFVYGRRGATFIAAIFCFASVIGAACSRSTAQLLACRILLGVGMGSKASAWSWHSFDGIRAN